MESEIGWKFKEGEGGSEALIGDTAFGLCHDGI